MFRPKSLRRSRPSQTRRLTHEALEFRRLLAVDVLLPKNQNMVMAEIATMDRNAPFFQEINFNSMQAIRIALSDDPADVFFDHGRQTVQLPTHAGSSSSSLQLKVDGDAM